MGVAEPTQDEGPRLRARVAALAGRQHGIVTCGQMVELGATGTWIARRVADGTLHRVHPRVYAVGFRPRNGVALEVAAVFAGGSGAALSHRSAATHWGLLPHWGGKVEIIASAAHRFTAVTVHRTRHLPGEDVCVHRGIAMTTPTRTIVDLGDVLNREDLLRAANEALRRRLTTREKLARAVPRRRAARPVRWLLGLGTGATRSTLEDRFVALCAAHDLPMPEVNAMVHGYEVDMVWRDQMLAVELDGREFHDDPLAFERDRERDAVLTEAGYRPIRITRRRLRETPELEIARVRRLLTRATEPPSDLVSAELRRA